MTAPEDPMPYLMLFEDPPLIEYEIVQVRATPRHWWTRLWWRFRHIQPPIIDTYFALTKESQASIAASPDWKYDQGMITRAIASSGRWDDDDVTC